LFSDQLSKAQASTDQTTLQPPKKADSAGKSGKASKAASKAVTAKGQPAKGAPADEKESAVTKSQPANPKGNDATANNEKQSEEQGADSQAQDEAPKIARNNLQQTKLPDEHAAEDPAAASGAETKDKTKSDPAAATTSTPTDLATAAASAGSATPKQPAQAAVNSNADAGTGLDASPQADLKIAASPEKSTNPQTASTTAQADAATADAGSAGASPAASDKTHALSKFDSAMAELTQAMDSQNNQAAGHAPGAQSAALTPTPVAQTVDAQFAADNHAQIVSSIHTQLLPGGGTMQIRLDPPELGALQVTVKMENGVLSASFQTSNDEATRVLTHSLGQLKTALETAGVSVARLHVQQAPKQEGSGSSGNEDNGKQQGSPDDRAAQQEQQRRENVRRMWARLAGGREALDLVA
jgi:flagellar hook-length control protein FliK